MARPHSAHLGDAPSLVPEADQPFASLRGLAAGTVHASRSCLTYETVGLLSFTLTLSRLGLESATGKVVEKRGGWDLAAVVTFFYACLDLIRAFFTTLIYGEDKSFRPQGGGGGRGGGGNRGGGGRDGSRISGMDSIRNIGSGCGPSGS